MAQMQMAPSQALTAPMGDMAMDHHSAMTATGSGPAVESWSGTATFQAGEQMMMNHHGTMALHTEYVRTSPVDMAKAQRVMQASMQLLAPLTWEGTEGNTWATNGAPNPNAGHRNVPESVRAEWKRLYPDLPVPNVVTFDQKTHVATGAMFVGGTKPVDLGMGAGHQHEAGKAFMQHIWFTPSNYEVAFNDEAAAEAKRIINAA
jgi:hypothetical protein